MSITSEKRKRPVTLDEAMEAAHALIDHYFNNSKGSKVKISIPVQLDDTDSLLIDYLQQTAPQKADEKATSEHRTSNTSKAGAHPPELA